MECENVSLRLPPTSSNVYDVAFIGGGREFGIFWHVLCDGSILISRQYNINIGYIITIDLAPISSSSSAAEYYN